MVYAKYSRLIHIKIYLFHLKVMLKMDSPICQYTKVVLAKGLLSSWNWRHVSFIIAVTKNYCGRGAKEQWGTVGLPPEKILKDCSL